MDTEEIFTYHAPKGDQAERYQKLREAAKNYAFLIQELTPKSAEQTLAIRRLQEASMYANAAIAINE